MNYEVGEIVDYNPFEDKREVIDSPAEAEYEVGEVLEINPFEGGDDYENDPKSSDADEPDENGHSLWDIPRLMGKGSAGMAKSASMLNTLTNPVEWATRTAGIIGDVTQNEALQTFRDYSAKHGLSAKLQQYGEEAEEYYDEKLTPAMKASMEKTILASGEEEGFFGEGIKDPWKIAGMIAESIPSTLVSMGGGALITKGLIQTGFKAAPKIVQNVLGKMVKKYGIEKVAGVVGGAIGEGGYSGLDNANNAFEEMMAVPQEKLVKSKTYHEIYNSLPNSLSDEKKHAYARKIIAMATAGFVGSTTAVTTGIFGAPSGAFMGKLIGGKAGKSFWGNLIKGAIPEAFTEAGEETLQSGMERLIQNIATKFLVDPNQELLEGTGEAMAAGAITGFAMGAGMGVGVAAVTPPSKAKDILTDGADVTAEDILLDEDEAAEIREKGKGKRFKGPESIEAEEEAGEFTEEELDKLAEKEVESDRTERPKGKVPGKKPQGQKAKPPVKPKGRKKAPGPSGVVQKPKTDEGKQVAPEQKQFDDLVASLTPEQFKHVEDLVKDDKMPIKERLGLMQADLATFKPTAAPKPKVSPSEENQQTLFDETIKMLNAEERAAVEDLIKDKKMPIGERLGLLQAELATFATKKKIKGDRREKERLTPAWDDPFRALISEARRQPVARWAETAKLRAEAGDPAILDLARRMGETIEAGTDLDDVLKTTHARIAAGMEPRKRTAEMTKTELKEAANTDYLTGLRNKKAFELEDTRRAHVTSIDLDSLKYINDAFGHQTGDAMLINFGNALKTITEADTYHVSGDEFIVQGDDPAVLEELLNKRVVDYLNKNPLTVITPDGKKIKYRVGFSYGTAETIAGAERALQKQKAERQAEGKRAGRGEIPPGIPGRPAKRQQAGDRGQRVPEKGKHPKVKTFKHFTTAERAEKIRKEGFKYGAEKPLFGTGSMDKGEKTGRFAGDAVYLSLDDKAWGALHEFEPSGPAVKATGKENRAETNLYYDYENQTWMAEPGKYKRTDLTGVDFEILPGTRVLKIDGIAALRKAAIIRFGHWDSPNFWKRIAEKYDAVAITNVDKALKEDPENKFFKSAMADQLIVLNKDLAQIKGETPPDTDDQAKIDEQLAGVDSTPTVGQRKAGNYKKGHFKFMGFNVTIENAPGDYREGEDSDGKKWRQKMVNAYGYFSRTEGKDGDEIDLFLGDYPETPVIQIVHQVDPKTRKPDEDKVMLGFRTPEEAKTAYLANYAEGWRGFGSMTQMLKPDFADWLDKQTKAKAAAKKEKAKKVEDPHWAAVGVVSGGPVAELEKTFVIGWAKDIGPVKKGSDLYYDVVGILSGGPADRFFAKGLSVTRKPPVLPTGEVAVVKGKKTSIITPGNRRGYSAVYAIVEADDLIPSHDAKTFQKNAGYPEGIQERTYHSDSQEQGKVISNAQNLNSLILLSDDPTPTNGPPIITESGIVLGGNSRAMSIQRAYAAQKKAARKAIKYKNSVSLQGSKFGLTPDDAFKVEKPVLVRVVYLEKEDVKTLHRMASDFNKTLTQGVSREAEIASMGKNISMATVEKIGLRMANNDKSLRQVLSKMDGLEILDWLIADDVIPPGDKNRYIDPNFNVINEPGKDKIEKAIFGSILDDADLLSAAPKSYVNKIERSLSPLARIKARGDQWDITPEVKEGLELATKAKNANLSIREHLKQGSLFGDEKKYSDIARALASHIENDTQNVLAGAFKKFAADAMADTKNQTHLFPPRTFSKAFKEAFQAEVAERGTEWEPESQVSQVKHPEEPGQITYEIKTDFEKRNRKTIESLSYIGKLKKREELPNGWIKLVYEKIEEKPAKIKDVVMMSPTEYLEHVATKYRKDKKDSGIDYTEKVKIEETGEIIDRNIDAVAYMVQLEDEIAAYESIRLCMGGRTK